jgi:GcrA cell cycle regulator
LNKSLLIVLKDRIIALWGEGKSQGQIAEQLGVTRNTIAGHVSRIRAGGTFLVSREPQKRSRIRRAPTPRRERARSSLPKPARPPEAPPPGDIVSLHVPFMELRRNQCRFPLKDKTYCGLPTKGSWCAHHQTICYQKTRGPDHWQGFRR